MMKKNLINIFSIFLIGFLMLNIIGISDKTAVNAALYPNSETIHFNTFGNFTQIVDNPFINSYLTEESLYFNYFGGSSDGYLTEAYMISFENFGNCTDFQLQATFNFTNWDLTDIVGAYLFVGSFYRDDGEYIGFNNEAESLICYTAIYDNWTDSKGYYGTAVYPQDTINYNQTPIGAEQYVDLTCWLSRNESGVHAYLFNSGNGTLLLESSCQKSEITKPVNYIMILFFSGTLTSDNTHAFWYEFNGSFIFDEFIPITPPTTPSGWTLSISGYRLITGSIAILSTIMFVQVTRKKWKS
ncbi:MAG: hypothetical protein FK734_01215 [Asgard group archaeon]|nr:hypothetical protein [Asgard group archaeon]